MEFLPSLLLAAWLLPLLSFVVIVLFGPRLGKAGALAGFVATGAILGSLVLSLAALATWIGVQGVGGGHAADHGGQSHAAAAADSGHGHSHPEGAPAESGQNAPTGGEEQKRYIAGDWYYLSPPGLFTISVGYYIDALTVAMFAMVSLIATCIHFYTMGYMHEELHDVTDHEVTLSDGKHLHRPGATTAFISICRCFASACSAWSWRATSPWSSCFGNWWAFAPTS